MTADIASAEAARMYLDHVKIDRRGSASYLETLEDTFRHWTTHRTTPQRLADLQRGHLQQFMRERYRDASSGTWNLRSTHMRGLLGWLDDEGILDNGHRIATVLTTVKVEKARKPRVTREQFEALREDDFGLYPRDRYLVLFAFKSVRRSNELAELKVGDIDRKPRPHHPHGVLRYSNFKASREDRSMRIDTELSEILDEWLEAYRDSLGVPQLKPSWYLFPRQEIDGLALKGIKTPMRLLPDCKIRAWSKLSGRIFSDLGWYEVGLGWHGCRRGGATDYYETFLEAGHYDAMEMVQQLLDHTSIVQTENYIDRKRSDMRIAKQMDDSDPGAKGGIKPAEQEGVTSLAAWRSRRSVG